MKDGLLLVHWACLVSACTTSRLTYAEKEEARRMLALRVSEVLEKRHLRIDVDYIMPKRRKLAPFEVMDILWRCAVIA